MLFYHNDKYLHPYLFCAPTSPYSLYCHGTLESGKTFSSFNNKRIKDKVPSRNSIAQAFPSVPRKISDPHTGNTECGLPLLATAFFSHFPVARPCILITECYSFPHQAATVLYVDKTRTEAKKLLGGEKPQTRHGWPDLPLGEGLGYLATGSTAQGWTRGSSLGNGSPGEENEISQISYKSGKLLSINGLTTFLTKFWVAALGSLPCLLLPSIHVRWHYGSGLTSPLFMSCAGVIFSPSCLNKFQMCQYQCLYHGLIESAKRIADIFVAIETGHDVTQLV